MKTIATLILLALLASCGKPPSSNHGNPDAPPEEAVEVYELASTYSDIFDGKEFSFGELTEGELEEPVTRIAVYDENTPDRVACWTKSVLYKNARPNVYLLQVYGTNTYAANRPECVNLEGTYWITLTSDYSAEIRK